MGAHQSRSHQLVLKSAAGEVEAVRALLEIYILQQQRIQRGLHPSTGHTHDEELIDINHQLPEGDFALEMATTHGHTLIVQLLLEHGCNVDQQDANGLTALMCACYEATTEISNILIKHGHASLDLQDSSGQTALHYAVINGNLAQVVLLIESGAKIDIVNNRGESPLLLAATNRRYTIAGLLIDAGANLYLTSHAGHQPIQFINDHAPSSLRDAISHQSSFHRCDELITTLYPFLTSSILETITEYDDQCYIQSKCIGLKRLILYLHHQNEAQDRAEHIRRNSMREAGIISPVTSPTSSSTTSTSIRSSDSLSIAPPSNVMIPPVLSPDITDPQSIHLIVSPNAILILDSPQPTPTTSTPSTNTGPGRSSSSTYSRQNILTVANSTDPSMDSVSTASLDSAINNLQYSSRGPRSTQLRSPIPAVVAASASSTHPVPNESSSLLELLPLSSSARPTPSSGRVAASSNRSGFERVESVSTHSSLVGREEEEEENEEHDQRDGLLGSDPSFDLAPLSRAISSDSTQPPDSPISLSLPPGSVTVPQPRLVGIELNPGPFANDSIRLGEELLRGVFSMTIYLLLPSCWVLIGAGFDPVTGFAPDLKHEEIIYANNKHDTRILNIPRLLKDQSTWYLIDAQQAETNTYAIVREAICFIIFLVSLDAIPSFRKLSYHFRALTMESPNWTVDDLEAARIVCHRNLPPPAAVPRPRLVGIELNPGPLQQITAQTLFKDGVQLIFSFFNNNDYVASVRACRTWHKSSANLPTMSLTLHKLSAALTLARSSLNAHYYKQLGSIDSLVLITPKELTTITGLFPRLHSYFLELHAGETWSRQHISTESGPILWTDSVIRLHIKFRRHYWQPLIQSVFAHLPRTITQLTLLQFHYERLTDLTPLIHLPHLSHLTLELSGMSMSVNQKYQWQPNKLLTLFLPLHQLQSLTYLSLKPYRILFPFADLFHLTQMQEYDLSQAYYFGAQDLEIIGKIFPNLIRLEPNAFSSISITFPYHQFVRLSKLTSLTFFFNEFTHVDETVVLNALGECSLLTELKLNRLLFSQPDSWSKLFHSVPTLTSLTFHFKSFTPSPIGALELIKKRLRALSLRRALFTTGDFDRLSQFTHLDSLVLEEILCPSDVTHTFTNCHHRFYECEPFHSRIKYLKIVEYKQRRRPGQRRRFEFNRPKFSPGSAVSPVPAAPLVGIELNPGPLESTPSSSSSPSPTLLESSSLIPRSAPSPATILFKDGLHCVFTFLSLRDFLQAIRTCARWYVGGSTIPHQYLECVYQDQQLQIPIAYRQSAHLINLVNGHKRGQPIPLTLEQMKQVWSELPTIIHLAVELHPPTGRPAQPLNSSILWPSSLTSLVIDCQNYDFTPNEWYSIFRAHALVRLKLLQLQFNISNHSDNEQEDLTFKRIDQLTYLTSLTITVRPEPPQIGEKYRSPLRPLIWFSHDQLSRLSELDICEGEFNIPLSIFDGEVKLSHLRHINLLRAKLSSSWLIEMGERMVNLQILRLGQFAYGSGTYLSGVEKLGTFFPHLHTLGLLQSVGDPSSQRLVYLILVGLPQLTALEVNTYVDRVRYLDLAQHHLPNLTSLFFRGFEPTTPTTVKCASDWSFYDAIRFTRGFASRLKVLTVEAAFCWYDRESIEGLSEMKLLQSLTLHQFCHFQPGEREKTGFDKFMELFKKSGLYQQVKTFHYQIHGNFTHLEQKSNTHKKKVQRPSPPVRLVGIEPNPGPRRHPRATKSSASTSSSSTAAPNPDPEPVRWDIRTILLGVGMAPFAFFLWAAGNIFVYSIDLVFGCYRGIQWIRKASTPSAPISGRALFPSPFPQSADSPYPDSRLQVKSSIELDMLHLMGAIKEKTHWYEKIQQDEIVARWKAEAKSQAPHLGDVCLNSCMDELRYEATVLRSSSTPHIQSSPVPGVYQTDDAIEPSLKAALMAGAAKLENVPEERKDYHPGSNRQVINLIHPSMYCYRIGHSPMTSQPFTLGDTLKVMGEKCVRSNRLIDLGQSLLKPNMSPDHLISKQFQWLPSDFTINENNEVSIDSYINNLHPIFDASLYTSLGRVFQRFIPLFERVLTDLTAPRIYRTMFTSQVQPTFWNVDGKFQPMTKEELKLHPPIEIPTTREGQTVLPPLAAMFDQPQIRLFLRPFRPPPPPPPRLTKNKHRFELGGRKLQVIVKLANIVLTPDQPIYGGGSWHIEGMKNESIVASGIYYYHSENISESRLAFRTTVHQYGLLTHHHYRLMHGIENDGQFNQELGSVLTLGDRCIAFPNIYQHQVQPFELLDRTKPGIRKILVFFLVDPGVQILSTAHVPPQQLHWLPHSSVYHQLLLNHPNLIPPVIDLIASYHCDDLGLMTRTEAEAVRRELMKERTNELRKERTFTIHKPARLFERGFSFCEH